MLRPEYNRREDKTSRFTIDGSGRRLGVRD